MEEVKALQIAVIKYTTLLVGIASAALFIGLKTSAIPFVLGLILGGAISVLTFMLLANTLVKASFMNPGRAQVYMGVNYFIRYAIIAIVLYISTQMPYLNVFATAIGILLVKGILYVIQLSDKSKAKQKLERKEE
jgi:hypothetical protein